LIKIKQDLALGFVESWVSRPLYMHLYAYGKTTDKNLALWAAIKAHFQFIFVHEVLQVSPKRAFFRCLS